MPRRTPPVKVPPGSKWCWACKAQHRTADFSPDARRSDGLRQYCRDGHAAWMRRHRDAARASFR